MNPATAIGAGVGAVVMFGGALAAGWAMPSLPPAPSLALTHARPEVLPQLSRPGGDLLFALDGLRGQIGDEVARPFIPVRRPIVYQPPPPPPPPDVTLVFRSEVTALVRAPGEGLAILLAQPGQRSRLLRPGDAFDDQWRLVSLTSSEAVLGDGVSERRVALFSGAASAPESRQAPGAMFQ